MIAQVDIISGHKKNNEKKVMIDIRVRLAQVETEKLRFPGGFCHLHRIYQV